MPFHSVLFSAKFLQRAVDVYTRRYLHPHPTIPMTFTSELFGKGTTPEIRCREPTPSSPEGAVEDAGGGLTNMLQIWSPGLQSQVAATAKQRAP